MELRKGEGFKISNNRPYLTKDGTVRVFANRTQAEAAAERVGGTAHQGLSMRFLVYIPEDAFHDYETQMERSVVKLTIDTLLAAGFELTVNDGVETVLVRSTDAAKILEVMFSTFEDYLIAFRPGATNRTGYVYFVYNNAASEVINDHTLSLEEILKPVEAYTDQLSERGL